MDNSDNKLDLTQIQTRLRQAVEFEQTELYADLLENFQADKNASEAQVFDMDVRDIFGFVIREQTIGERRVQKSVLDWLSTYKEELQRMQESILAEMELNSK